MEANNFITKLKANGTSADVTDLCRSLTEYKSILTNLSVTERSLFALNVFCALCRNLEKVPSWCSKIDYKSLLDICILCVRDSKQLSGEQRLKVLGCIYHLQKSLVHMETKIQLEIVLKSSFLAFEEEILIENYGKTYWNIIVDRLIYMERLKTNKTNIIKLLDSITQDVIKIIQIFETYDFISNYLLFLVKKLYFLYSDFHIPQLSNAYETLFEALSQKKDSDKLNSLKDEELADVYVKFNNWIIVIAENDNRNAFKNTILSTVVKCCVSLLGRYESVFHMYQTYHLNFSSLLTEKCNSKFIETIFNNMSKTFDLSEKTVYKNILNASVPFLYQVMKLFIEFIVGNVNNIQWDTSFNTGAQLKCMQFIAILMPKLCKGTQIVKCENCTVKSGLHDALILSFLTKNFITISLNKQIDLTDMLPEYYNMLIYQLKTIDELSKLKCINSVKCYKKIQTDIHDTAILLNKHTYYEYSIKLFDLYLITELKTEANELDYENISQAFYFKAICELDFKMYKTSIISAGLSQLFAFKYEANDKQMGLIIEVKAKQLNVKNFDNELDLQNVSLLDIYNMAVNDNSYGDLRRFFGDLKFSSLLRHEFTVYARLWPSMQPVGGVWKSLCELAERKYPELLTVENENDILWVLYEIILKTTSTVKTIHNDVLENIILKIIKNFERNPPLNYYLELELRMIHSSLKIIQGEYDLKKANEKFGWKIENNANPDKTSYNRSVNDELTALKNILEAVTSWNELAPALIQSKDVAKGPYLSDVLNILEIGALELLNYCKLLEGLQLAHIGCVLAQHWGLKLHYVRNGSLILYYARSQNPRLDTITKLCADYTSELGHNSEHINWVLIFVCNRAMYNYRRGSYRDFAQLIQYVQSTIQDMQGRGEFDNVNLNMSIGHLLEAQTMLTGDAGSPTQLSSVVTTQRHFLNITSTGTSFYSTRYSYLLRLAHISQLSILAVNISAQLKLWRGANATAGSVPILAALHWVQARAGACNSSFGDEAMNTIEFLETVLNIDSGTSVKRPNSTKTNIKNQPPKIILKSKEINVKNSGTSEKRPNSTKTNIKNQPPKKILKSKEINVKNNDCDLNSNVTEFKMADFFKHDSNCHCFVCETPFIYILTSKLYNLKAGTYYKQKQHEIARNYFNGALTTIGLIENKLKVYRENNSKLDETYLMDIVEKIYKDYYFHCAVELLIDAAFFEMSQYNFHALDDHVVRILEIKQEYIFNKHLNSEVYKLLYASTEIKKRSIKTDAALNELEKEMSSIQLSPNKRVPDEELQKLLPIPIDPKLFKTPMPSKLNAIKTFEDLTTPTSDSPEQFFTPMSSIKPYSSGEIKNVAVNRVPDEKLPKLLQQPIEMEIKKRSIKTDAALNELEKEMSSIQLSPNKRVPDEELQKLLPIPIDPKLFKTPMPSKLNAIKTFEDLTTPTSDSPEQFFTPMSSIKPYSSGEIKNVAVNRVPDEKLPKLLQQPIEMEIKKRSIKTDAALNELEKEMSSIQLSPNKRVPDEELPKILPIPIDPKLFKTPMPSKLNAIKTFEDLTTPTSDSPEQFFTPMTSIKPYSSGEMKNVVAVTPNEGFSLDNKLQNDENEKNKSKDNEKKLTINEKKSAVVEKKSMEVKRKTTEVKKKLEDQENVSTSSKNKTGARPKEKSSLQKITIEKAKSSKIPDSSDKDSKNSRSRNQRASSPVKTQNVRPIRQLKPPNKY